MDREFEAAVSATVEEQGPVTATEVAAYLGAHPVRVQRVCDQLQRADRLRQVTGGGYVRVEESSTPQVVSD